jgi:GntR family transcriptional repressor for pyruvate dehydrogenase complex
MDANTQISALQAQRKNLSEVVAEAIMERIAQGEFGIGDRLPTEYGLMEAYGVGRNVVREAVRQLVALGLLDVRPGRGAIVVSVEADGALDTRVVSALLSDQTVKDLYEFRMLIEVEIVARAAERATPADIAAIADEHRRYARLLAAGGPVYLADVAFHRAIAVASGNSVYVRVIDALSDLLEATRKQTDHVPQAPETALSEHEEILEAVRAHQVRRSRAAMRKHITTATTVISSVK